jgi:hypothetical protein
MDSACRSGRAATREEKVITGRRLNEETYTVELIDKQEHLISLEKADLREYTAIKTLAMDSYKDKSSWKEIAAVPA